jgi:glycosyltransferase involved in cell wall biosynthesis
MTYLHLLTRRSVRRQPMVITVSEYSRREILRHARLQPDQVRVVPNAPNPAFSVRPRTVAEAFRARLGLRNHVIAADAIKNPATVLAAYRRLPDELREQTSLVFFSRRMPASEVVAASQSGECTLLLKPSIDDLVVLLNLAELLVFPSLYEGFGLPVVEAMSCGTPVIASNVGSLPEIVADTGIVVEPLDPTAIAAAVTQLLLHPLQRRDLAARATRRAARYSWEATMRATIDVYMDALSSAQSPVNQPARQPTAS